MASDYPCQAFRLHRLNPLERFHRLNTLERFGQAFDRHGMWHREHSFDEA